MTEVTNSPVIQKASVASIYGEVKAVDPGTKDQGTHRNPTLLGTFYTSQYSILVLGTSASSLELPIHFFPLVASRTMFTPIRNYKRL